MRRAGEHGEHGELAALAALDASVAASELSYGGWVMESFRRIIEPILGTRLTLRIDAVDAGTADLAEVAAVHVADGLEASMSLHRPNSAFSLWRRGELADPPAEVVTVLALALHWFERTDGAFNPYLDALVRRWNRSEAEQRLPDDAELARLSAAARPPYRIADDRVVALGDCTIVNVHGLAKGWVIDRMIEAAAAVTGVAGVIVDVGGDLRHRSDDETSVATIAVENPFDAVDNAPPLTIIRVTNRAVATSSGGRRGWRIDGAWYGHLLDPATGRPLAAQRSATVVAATAADADAAASAAVVIGHELFEHATDVAVLVVDGSGVVSRNALWRESVPEVQ